MIRTERLWLREWRDEDVVPFAELIADPEVMFHLGGVPADPLAEARAAIGRQRAAQARDGHCLWAMERADDDALLGFCGLRIGGHPGTPTDGLPDIGWRLRRDAWGAGVMREAAAATLGWAWRNRPWPSVASWTIPDNRRSWGLMRRLGMARRPDLDFGHPGFPSDHPLHRHIVYAAKRPGTRP